MGLGGWAIIAYIAFIVIYAMAKWIIKKIQYRGSRTEITYSSDPKFNPPKPQYKGKHEKKQ